MAKGTITQKTPLMSIGTELTVSAPNTFTQTEVELPLSEMLRQVFVVTDIEIRLTAPELIANINTRVDGQVTKSSQTAMIGFGSADCMARAVKEILAITGVAGEAAVYIRPETSPRQSIGKLTEDYLDILASDNYFVAIDGTNNVGSESLSCKVTGFIAEVDADVYAALVVSESRSA